MKKFLVTMLMLSALLSMPACAKSEDITIKRADGQSVIFNVEFALDYAAREHGLMNRISMPRNAGMLFVYPEIGRPGFWMKNTLIPLDMLFFAKGGELAYIHPSATPGSLAIIDPGRNDICAVLELNGGEAAAQGLKPGDRLDVTGLPSCLP